MITASGVRKLLSLYKASPASIDLLRAFGQRSSFEGDSYIHFASRSLQDSNAGKITTAEMQLLKKTLSECYPSETTYIFRHVEEHGRPDASERWSVRQMGIYSQAHPSAGNTFIILNPSTPFQKHLRYIIDRRRPPLSMDIHRAIFLSSVSQWRWYIDDIESRYLDIVSQSRHYLDNV